MGVNYNVLGLIFAIMLNALILEFFFNVILNRQSNLKKMLILLLVSLIGGGISIGILTIEISKYEIIESHWLLLKL